ncbi:MAG: hypothetical protein HRT61_24515 [Ekhidna sp.]|nr:hypothetical protein [Ekhidna sp.]
MRLRIGFQLILYILYVLMHILIETIYFIAAFLVSSYVITVTREKRLQNYSHWR